METAMHGQSHVRFKLMMGWCSLLSIAVMIMAILLATTINHQNLQIEKKNKSTEVPSPDHPVTDMYKRSSSINHIHLISGMEEEKKRWVISPFCFCQNTSLILQDTTVTIKVRGFYHTYAQVTFPPSDLPLSETESRSVTLIANQNRDGKKVRKLSEAPYHKETKTISMSRVIHLESGDTVQLDIKPTSAVFSKDETQTYWGLYLLNSLDN